MRSEEPMQDDATPETDSAEHAEFKTLVTAFSNTPRSLRLLRYIGENYFSGHRDELCEYNIATKVFGRPENAFNPAEDAIARAETHRLRKRLKEYYSGEGKHHAVQFSLPPATYVPVFVPSGHHAPAPSHTAFDAEIDHSLNEESLPEEQGTPEDQEAFQATHAAISAAKKRPRMLLWIGIAALLLAGIAAGINLLVAAHRERGRVESAQAVAASSLPSTMAVPAVSTAESVRLLAGYAGSPHIDSVGAVWKADQYFQGGLSHELPPVSIAKTTSPFIFGHWREGNFEYDIPLKPGLYELHLYFLVTTDPRDSLRTFFVKVNDQTVLSDFDVDSDAFGPNIADERIFRDISPAGDGMLHIFAANEVGAPLVNAIEIVPGTPHRQLPIRLVTRSTPYMDHLGQIWHPDDYFMEGHLSTELKTISGTPDPEMLAAERYGHFSYTIPVDPRDRYTVVLHFAEHFFGPQGTGSGGVGSRIFRVLCNNDVLLDNFDIYKEVGGQRELTKTFYHLKPTLGGKLNLMFEPIVNNATVSSIEILDESR